MTNYTQPPPPVQQLKASQAAVWSLVLGILSLVCLGPLAGIPAIICGHTARANIKNSSGSIGGAGMALAGLILGYFSTIAIVLMFMLGMLGAIAIPSFVKARESAQNSACINNLRLIDGAKELWAMEKNQASDAVPTQSEVETYLKEWPACPKGGTYTIGNIETRPTCDVPGHALPEY